MIGGSVKNLNTIMTYVSNAGKSGGDSLQSGLSFGDVMTKAGSNQNKTDIESKVTQDSKTNETAKSLSDTDKSRLDSNLNSSRKNDISSEKNEDYENVKVESDTDRTGETVSSRTEEAPEAKGVLEEESKELIEEISKLLDVSIEEIIEAIENLGLTPVSLLDSTNIGQLVLELSDEQDSIALVTNEDLFNTVKDLTAMVDATVVDLANDMDMEVPEVKELISEFEFSYEEEETKIDESVVDNMQIVNNTSKGMEMSVEANSDINTIKDPTSKIVVEVNKENSEESEESIEINVDNHAIVEKKEDNDGKDFKDSKNDKHFAENDHHEKNGEGISSGFKLQGLSVGNPILNNQFNIVNETAQAIADAPFATPETSEIMDQILDHMKVNLHNDVQELEMQLHPASLGSVKVNLTSRAGEITAEIRVQNEQVRAAVEAQLNDLRETFKATGTKVTAIEVSVELQSFDSNLWQGKGHDTGSQDGDKERRRNRRISIDNLDALFADEEADEDTLLAAEMLKATGGTVDFTA